MNPESVRALVASTQRQVDAIRSFSESVAAAWVRQLRANFDSDRASSGSGDTPR